MNDKKIDFDGLSMQDFFKGSDNTDDNLSFNSFSENNSNNILDQLGNVFDNSFKTNNVEEIKTDDIIERKNSDAFDNLEKFIDNKDMGKEDIAFEMKEEKTIKPSIPKDMDDLYSDVLFNERKPLSEVLKSHNNEKNDNDYVNDSVDSSENEEELKNITNEDSKENNLSSVLRDLKETKSNIQDNAFEKIKPIKEDYKIQLDSQPYVENLDIEIPNKDENIDDKVTSNVLRNFKKQSKLENENTTEKAINELNDFVVFKKKEVKKVENSQDQGTINLGNENSSIYNYIYNAYPNLSKDFIVAAYGLKEIFYNNYRRYNELIVLHRCSFSSLDKLHNFVEIVIGHNYSINVDEKQMIVDVFKVFENTEGAILSNIFTIANQAKLLDGEYEGYRIISKED